MSGASVPEIDAAILELRQMHDHYVKKCGGGCPAEAAIAGLEALRAKVDHLATAAKSLFDDAEDRGETRTEDEDTEDGGHEMGELYDDYLDLAEALVSFGVLDADVLEPQP